MVTVKDINKKLNANNYDLTLLSEEELSVFEGVTMLRKHVGKIVRHFKGKFYLILDIVEHTETGEELVIYKAMYGDYKKYARPIDMFISEVDRQRHPDIKQKYRMEFVEFK